MLPSKLEVFRALLIRGDVFIHISPSRGWCVLPSYLRAKDSVILQVGLDMPVPIPDLKYNANAFFGTLSFNGEPYYVSIPWGCVYALVGEDSKGMVWKDEMPPTIMETKGNVIPITSKVRLNTTKAKCKPKELRSDRSHLRLVK